jgi:hypothetical protein
MPVYTGETGVKHTVNHSCIQRSAGRPGVSSIGENGQSVGREPLCAWQGLLGNVHSLVDLGDRRRERGFGRDSHPRQVAGASACELAVLLLLDLRGREEVECEYFALQKQTVRELDGE